MQSTQRVITSANVMRKMFACSNIINSIPSWCLYRIICETPIDRRMYSCSAPAAKRRYTSGSTTNVEIVLVHQCVALSQRYVGDSKLSSMRYKYNEIQCIQDRTTQTHKCLHCLSDTQLLAHCEHTNAKSVYIVFGCRLTICGTRFVVLLILDCCKIFPICR